MYQQISIALGILDNKDIENFVKMSENLNEEQKLNKLFVCLDLNNKYNHNNYIHFSNIDSCKLLNANNNEILNSISLFQS